LSESLNDRFQKEKTSSISFDAMKFGSENELRIALTELRWIKRNKGRVTNSDFKIISEKYRFPIDFLKKGFRGFSYPEDYLISKSKWFPILYSWVVQDRQHFINLSKLKIDYIRTRYRSMLFLGILGTIFLQASFTLRELFNFSQLLSLVVAFILSFISLYVGLRNN